MKLSAFPGLAVGSTLPGIVWPFTGAEPWIGAAVKLSAFPGLAVGSTLPGITWPFTWVETTPVGFTELLIVSLTGLTGVFWRFVGFLPGLIGSFTLAELADTLWPISFPKTPEILSSDL